MDIEYAVLATAANSSVIEPRRIDINILGLFDRIYVDKLPYQQGPFALVMGLRTEPEDSNQTHEITITIIDEEGKSLFPVITSQNWESKMVLPERYNRGHAIYEFAGGVVFKNHGEHRVDIRVDGRTLKQIPLLVAKR